MGTPLEEILAGLSLERRQKIEKRSAELIAEEMKRQQLLLSQPKITYLNEPQRRKEHEERGKEDSSN